MGLGQIGLMLVLYQTQSHAHTTQRKVNDDDTNIRGKGYNWEKCKVYILGASGLAGVPMLGPHASHDTPKA